MLKHNILLAIGLVSFSGFAATDSTFVMLDSIPDAQITEIIGDTNRMHDQVAPVKIPSTSETYFTQIETGNTYVKMQVRSFDSENNTEVSTPFILDNTNSVVGVSANKDTVYLTGSADGRLSFQQGLIKVHRTAVGWSEPELIKVKGFKPTSWTYGMYMHPDGDLLLIYQKKGVSGNFELSISKRTATLEFGKPMRLESLNTDADEITPYLSDDKKRLYFSSNVTTDEEEENPNYDLWVCDVKNADFTEFSKPRKLPIGVNKKNSYESYAVEIDSANIIFSSDRSGKGMRLYKASLMKKPEIEEVPVIVEVEEEVAEIVAEVTPDTIAAPAPEVMVTETSNKLKFALNSAKLSRSNIAYLKENFSPTTENMAKTKAIAITGFTDNTGAASYNLSLSKKRANSVKKALISLGWDASIITTTGKGEESPIANNANLDGRIQNRRVEIEVEKVK